MQKSILVLLTVVSAVFLAGCGSSNGTTTSVTTPGSSSISILGKVADGYLVGATVFLDKNKNYQLDAGEPSAITDNNGAYTLKIDPADVGKYPIVAIATKGVTVDKDTGTAVQNSYVLSMPATAVSGTVNSNFISPMSSQLREMMETGNYSTMQQAIVDLRTKLGMPTDMDMMDDYIAANNTDLHSAARNMAGLMGNQMSQIFTTSGSTTGVDVNRYRGMMGTIFSNMPQIKGSDASTQTALSNLSSTMMSNLANIKPGQPFRNMSSAFRGGMMSGTNFSATTGTTVPSASNSGLSGGANSSANGGMMGFNKQ